MGRANELQKLFESLKGQWILLRELQSKNASEPSGFCHGTASFTSREPSPVMGDDGELDLAAAELLYSEEGELEVSNTVKFKFSRKYIWRLKQDSGVGNISVWFTRPGTELIDYLFHKIDIDMSRTSKSDHGSLQGLEGNGGHLCVEDFYSSSYTFYLSENAEHQSHAPLFSAFQSVHEVRGPQKDQVITTQFARSREQADQKPSDNEPRSIC